jgi:adenine phosphoribosyltransferase
MYAFEKSIRTIPDFPSPGVHFKDINPLLQEPAHFSEAIAAFEERYKDQSIDVIIGIESRGFIFASALAYALHCGLALVRKPGKLPGEIHTISYELEYGKDQLEIQKEALQNGARVLLIDDVLATGGTMQATRALLDRHFNIELISAAFLIELTFLNGRERLENLPIESLIRY